MVDTVDSKSIAKSVEVQILSRAISCCTILNVSNGIENLKELLYILFLSLFHIAGNVIAK